MPITFFRQNTEGKKLFGRHRRRWENIIKNYLEEVGRENVNRIYLA
jgi:hypothetical protein